MAWQLQDAKNRFSEIVEKAQSEGPQEVTVSGKRTAVVLSAAEYDRLAGAKQGFVDALLSGPEWDDDFVASINDRRPWSHRDADL